MLGKGLKGVARNRFLLSTKVGKYTAPGSYGNVMDAMAHLAVVRAATHHWVAMMTDQNVTTPWTSARVP